MIAIENILKRQIKKGDTVILGVSGGPDSVFLLHQCLALAKKHPFRLIVAHLNHNLRGADSNRDEQFVKEFAADHKLIFETKKIGKISSGNIEEEARNARYRFFAGLLEKHAAACIMTAHHRDDNIETILFNLIRGSFLDGLTGMETFSPERKIFRPLLEVSKKEILQYLSARRIPFRMDKSNNDLKLSRNLIRHKIIPLIKKINPNFENTFSKNIELLKETSQYIGQNAERICKKGNSPHLETFLSQSKIIQKTIINRMYRDLHGNAENFNRSHLAQILQMLDKKQSGLKKEFGKGHFIAVTKDKNNKRCIKILKSNP